MACSNSGCGPYLTGAASLNVRFTARSSVRSTLFGRFTIAVALCGISIPLAAHHGNAGYEMDKMTVKKATVTQFDWTNPHSQIHLDLTTDSGDVEHWTIEAPPPAILIDRDWTRKSLQPGDAVTAYFHAARNGAKVGIIQKLILADGKALVAYPDPQAPPEK